MWKMSRKYWKNFSPRNCENINKNYFEILFVKTNDIFSIQLLLLSVRYRFFQNKANYIKLIYAVPTIQNQLTLILFKCWYLKANLFV